MSENIFDVVVIGAGPGGYVAAIRAAQDGFKTAIIEGHKLGGECLNYGCIPSKAFISAGHLLDGINNSAEMGIKASKVDVDLDKMCSWKDSIVNKLTTGVGSLLKANGVTLFNGLGSFSGLQGSYKKISVAKGIDSRSFIENKSEKTEVLAKNVIIATGSSIIEIPGFKYDGKKILNSEQALANTKIPKKIVVIGGGFIGLEIGTFYSKLKVDVTVVEATDKLLAGTDPECVRVVQKNLQKKGVKILLNTKAHSVDTKKSKCVLTVNDKDKKSTSIECDWVLVSVGRKPNTTSLGLEKIGVDKDSKGFIPVNGQLLTSVPGVYAIGDVIGGAMLAHKASKEALVAVDVIKNPQSKLDIKALPWAIFVDPEIASVGHTLESAKAAGFEPVVGKCPFAANGRALTTGHSEGFAKIIVDKNSDLVLGAHIVGPEASNLIAEVALAIEMSATASDIAETIHAHPTLPECLLEAAESVHGRAIHIFSPKKK